MLACVLARACALATQVNRNFPPNASAVLSALFHIIRLSIFTRKNLENCSESEKVSLIKKIS